MMLVMSNSCKYDMKVVLYLKCINVGQNLLYDVLVTEINDIDGVGQVIFAFVIWTVLVFASPVPDVWLLQSFVKICSRRHNIFQFSSELSKRKLRFGKKTNKTF